MIDRKSNFLGIELFELEGKRARMPFLSSFSRCYGSLNPAVWSVNLHIFNTCYISPIRNCFRVNRVNRFRLCGYYRNKMTHRFVHEMTYRRDENQYFHFWMHQTLESFFNFLASNYLSLQKKKEEKEHVFIFLFNKNSPHWLIKDYERLIRKLEIKLIFVRHFEFHFDQFNNFSSRVKSLPRDYQNYFTFNVVDRRQNFSQKNVLLRKKKREKKMETTRVRTKGSRGERREW